MSHRILENEKLRVTISDRGAELISAIDKKNGRERLWKADPAVWNRQSAQRSGTGRRLGQPALHACPFLSFVRRFSTASILPRQGIKLLHKG